MLAIAPESRPSYLVELVARALASVAGPMPLASANKGMNSEDPTVEEQFDRECGGGLDQLVVPCLFAGGADAVK